MKSRKIPLLPTAAIYILTIVLILVVPRLKTAESGSGGSQDPEAPIGTNPATWLPTWKNTFNRPYESFVNQNHRDYTCIAQEPCVDPPSGMPDYVVKAVANWNRFPQDIWADPTTKPWQVLTFMGVKPGNVVVDIISGNRATTMYWSRLFYHLVGGDIGEGRVFPFIPSIGCRAAHVVACQNERDFGSTSKGYGARPHYTILGDPRWNGIDEALEIEHTVQFRNLYALLDVAGEFGVPLQADVVWSTGIWHQFHGEVFDLDMSNFMPRVFEEINNGGTLVIADYAGKPGTGFTQVDTLHRVDKEAVKAEVTKYGFVFDSESDIWAKKDDDHTRVVPEQAPPGTADMFILKFKKPMNAPPPHRLTRQQLAGLMEANYNETMCAPVPGPKNKDIVTAVISCQTSLPEHAPATNDPLDHGKKGGGGTWYSANYTTQEFQGPDVSPAAGMLDSWFVSATGEVCLRQQFTPITEGIVGCHYFYDQSLKYFSKLGNTFIEMTDFSKDEQSNPNGYTAPAPRELSAWHTFAPHPDWCTEPTLAEPNNDCRYDHEYDFITYGHVR